MKHLFGDCPLVKSCLEHVQTNMPALLQAHLHWCAILLCDTTSVVRSSLRGIWHCLRIPTLFVLCKTLMQICF
jgi:hypothetical protein